MRLIGTDDIDDLALGASLLGAGGGGDPYIGTLMVRQALERHGPVTVVDPADLPPDGLVTTVGLMGSPTVVLEKIPSGTELLAAVRAMARFMGRDPVALMPIEVGGMNTLVPLAIAGELGLPVVDADPMRRAFPQIEMTVFTLAGISATPLVVADEKGNVCVMEAQSNRLAETLARGAVTAMGMSCALAAYALSPSQVAAHAIPGSLTYCTELGRRIGAVQRGEEGAFDRLLGFAGARLLFSGKVVDVERRTTAGFATGTVRLEHLADARREMRVEFQNENLVAFEGQRVLATVPDLICLIDHETARPVLNEAVAYGQRLDVIGLPCAPEWQRDGWLDLVGPRAFGYALDHVPVSDGRVADAPGPSR